MRLLLITVVSGLVGTARAADLLTSYRQAADSSPAIARTRSLLKADESARVVARGALAPKVSARGSLSQNQIDLKGFGPEAIDENYSASSYSVTLTQPLISGSNWATLKASGAQVKSSEAAFLAAEQNLILQVAVAYFGVLRARAFERAAASEQALLLKIKDEAETARRTGTGGIIAVQEAQARLDGARSELLSASNTWRIARRSLQRLTHEPTGELLDLKPFEPEGPVPARMEAWVEVAMARQPVLERARQDLEASRMLTTSAKRGRWPVIALDAEYSDADGAFAPDIMRREGYLGVSAAWPFFQGGAISGAKRRAAALAEASQHEVEAMEDQVRLDTEQAFLVLENSVAQLKAAQRALTSSETALKATQKGYEIGTRSVIDLLDSTRRRTDAETAYSSALYNQVVARLQLKGAAGILTEEDVMAVNGLLAHEADGEQPSGADASPDE